MARRVRPGEKLNITAAEYKPSAGCSRCHCSRSSLGGGGNRTHVRDAAHRSRSLSKCDHCAHRGIVGFNAHSAILTSTIQHSLVCVRDATIQSVRPIADEHTGRFGVAIEPIAEDKVGRVGVRWRGGCPCEHTRDLASVCDVADAGGTTLQSKPNGSAQILWQRGSKSTGVQWLLFELGNPRSSFPCEGSQRWYPSGYQDEPA